MAEWARLMFYATAATVLLTFAALAAIIRTLHHTRRAADYTEDMLIEAKATIAEAMSANQIMRAEQRPWLKLSCKYGTEHGWGKTGLVCKIFAENIGQRPATNLTYDRKLNFSSISDKTSGRDTPFANMDEIVLPSDKIRIAIFVVPLPMDILGIDDDLEFWVTYSEGSTDKKYWSKIKMRFSIRSLNNETLAKVSDPNLIRVNLTTKTIQAD